MRFKFQPGAKNDYDPDYVFDTTDDDMIRDWIDALEPLLSETTLIGEEHAFVREAVERYRRRQKLGTEAGCFTGKQLVWLKKIVKMVSLRSIRDLKRLTSAT